MNAISQSSTLTQASREWFSRPDDERFLNLDDMSAFMHGQRDHSLSRVISSRKIEAYPAEGDQKGLVILAEGKVSAPNNWAFGQMCGLISAPANYLRTLTSPLAADNVNEGFHKRDAKDTGLLLYGADENLPTLAATTGPNYGRVWNKDVVDALRNRFGDGATGRFKVPGEFGKAVTITKANTTLYAGDRDMFVFLADEENRIQIDGRRNGRGGSLARGFFVWNSQVGSATLGIGTFLFDYACSNRIVWGAEGYKEIRIRHTSSAPDRFIEEVAPAIQSYADSSSSNIEDALKRAQEARIGNAEAVEDFLEKRRFTSGQRKGINLAHLSEEGKPIETVWDAVTGITAYAKGLANQDQRVPLEREAGKLLDLVK
jgi:hypothetical protein